MKLFNKFKLFLSIVFILSCHPHDNKNQQDYTIDQTNSSKLMSDQIFEYQSLSNHKDIESINGKNLKFTLSEEIKDIESLKKQVKNTE